MSSSGATSQLQFIVHEIVVDNTSEIPGHLSQEGNIS